MGAAISLLVLMSISVFIVRVASVALRHTGLDDATAKFQALSAISSTGFTTREAESVVNYPVRRRIIMFLMVLGNLGVVTVMATLVVSFVRTEGDVHAILIQVFWLVGVLALLWFLILSKRAEQFICKWIGRALDATTLIGKRHFMRLLQVGDGHSVCEHPVAKTWLDANQALNFDELRQLGLVTLAVHRSDGDIEHEFASTADLSLGDTLILFGTDTAHDALEALAVNTESDAEFASHGHEPRGD